MNKYFVKGVHKAVFPCFARKQEPPDSLFYAPTSEGKTDSFNVERAHYLLEKSTIVCFPELIQKGRT